MWNKRQTTFRAVSTDVFLQKCCRLGAYPAFQQFFMCLEMKQLITPVIVLIWTELGASGCCCSCCDLPHFDSSSQLNLPSVCAPFFCLDTIQPCHIISRVGSASIGCSGLWSPPFSAELILPNFGLQAVRQIVNNGVWHYCLGWNFSSGSGCLEVDI